MQAQGRPTTTRLYAGRGLDPFPQDAPRAPRQFCSKAGCHRSGAIDAGVVGDGDTERQREGLAEMLVEPVNRMGQHGLLVVHRHHDVENRNITLGSGHVSSIGTKRG